MKKLIEEQGLEFIVEESPKRIFKHEEFVKAGAKIVTDLSPAGMAEQVDREVLDIIKLAHEKAIAILNENREKLHELSHHLLIEETITGAEFMKILEA